MFRTASAALLEEPDVPTAGTPCIACKTNNHFCQADEWVGDSDQGICQSCSDGRTCHFMSLRASDNQVYVPEKVDENGHLTRPWAKSIVSGLAFLKPGDSVLLIPPDAMNLITFQQDIQRALELSPNASQYKWTSHANEERTGMVFVKLPREKQQVISEKLQQGESVKQIAAVLEVPKDAVRQVKEAEKVPRVASYKPEKTAQVERMLQSGYPTNTVIERTGLSKNTILTIKKRLGLPLATRPGEKDEIVHRKADKWTAVLDKLLKLKDGEQCMIDVPSGTDQKMYGNQLRSMLHTSTLTICTDWGVSYKGFDHQVRVTRGSEHLNRGDRPRTVIPRNSTDVGRPQVVDRPAIESLINDGKSVRSTAEVVQVSTNTVQRIKREMNARKDEGDSIYEKSLEHAQDELKVIVPELERLLKRKEALTNIVAALEQNLSSERATR